MKRTVMAISLAGALVLAPSGVQAGGAPDAPAAASGAAQHAYAAACRSVHYGGRSYVLYRQGRVRCLFAKRWVRRLHRSEGENSPPGWTCESGSNFRTGGGCSKGRRAFGWHPGD